MMWNRNDKREWIWPSKVRLAFVRGWKYTQRKDTELGRWLAACAFPDSDLPESAPRDPGVEL